MAVFRRWKFQNHSVNMFKNNEKCMHVKMASGHFHTAVFWSVFCITICKLKLWQLPCLKYTCQLFLHVCFFFPELCIGTFLFHSSYKFINNLTTWLSLSLLNKRIPTHYDTVNTEWIVSEYVVTRGIVMHSCHFICTFWGAITAEQHNAALWEKMAQD